jgi:hypothetical protein
MAAVNRLQAAHAKVSETKAALAASVKTASAAKTLLDSAEKELAKHRRRHEEKTAARAGKLMQALKLGSQPAFKKSVTMASDYMVLKETEHRRDAAQIAVDQLAAEVEAANAAHDAAKAAVGVEARAILAAEANEHAERIASLEQEALRHRIRLEGAARSGTFGYRPIALSDLAKRILIENNHLTLSTRNMEPWVEANASAESWRQALADLMKSGAPSVA